MYLANLPTIPFIHSVEDQVFFFYIFCRYTGLFLISPLLTNRNISMPVRLGLTLFVSALTAMVLYDDYMGTNPRHTSGNMLMQSDFGMIKLLMTSVIEMIVGYLIGFIFYLLVESVILAGQQAGMLLGFTMAEIMDPISGTSQGLVAQMFLIVTSLLLLVMDLHHMFIRVTHESFQLVPIGQAQFPQELIKELTSGGSRVFDYSLRFIAIPFVSLMLITAGLGLMTRVLPEMNIFMVGFPVKILIGILGVYAAIGYFPEVVESFFTELVNLSGRVLRLMTKA